MNIIHRIEDIEVLRNEVFRDYLKMALKPGWQKSLHEEAKEKIERRDHIEKYRPIYDRMHDYGIDNYSVDDMDMTAMIQLVLYSSFDPFQFKPEGKTRNFFHQFKNDRNTKGHLTGKEEADELFAYGIFALKRIKDFIVAVDENEKMIPEEDRSAFRIGNIKKIDILRKSLLKDLGRYAQIRLEADEYIEKFKKAGPEEALSLRCEIGEHYFLRYHKTDPERLTEFYFCLADAEIIEFFGTSFRNLVVNEDYDRADYILNKWFNCLKNEPKADFKEMVDILEWAFSFENGPEKWRRTLKTTPLMKEIYEKVRGNKDKTDEGKKKAKRRIVVVPKRKDR